MQLGSRETENERFAHYLTKTYRKTASLIANALKAVSKPGNQHATRIAMAIAIAFQIAVATALAIANKSTWPSAFVIVPIWVVDGWSWLAGDWLWNICLEFGFNFGLDFDIWQTAVIAQADDNVAEVAFQYGRNIGLAFQLVDDMLDFVSSTEQMGKPTAADLKLGLATAPVLFACEKVSRRQTSLLLQQQLDWLPSTWFKIMWKQRRTADGRRLLLIGQNWVCTALSMCISHSVHLVCVDDIMRRAESVASRAMKCVCMAFSRQLNMRSVVNAHVQCVQSSR